MQSSSWKTTGALIWPAAIAQKMQDPAMSTIVTYGKKKLPGRGRVGSCVVSTERLRIRVRIAFRRPVAVGVDGARRTGKRVLCRQRHNGRARELRVSDVAVHGEAV